MKKLSLLLLMLLCLFSCGFNQKDSSIVVYTNSGSNGRAEFLKEEAKKAGFDITIVDAGGSDLSNRLHSESSNPIANVIFGLNAIEYEKLKKANVLQKYTPSWAKDVPKGLSDEEGYYNAVSQNPLIAVYNKEYVKDIPNDWITLALDSTYKGKYFILKPSTGTSKVIFSSIISRYKDKNGELGISNEGWEIIKKWYNNGVVQMNSEEDFWGNIMKGKIPITMIWGSGAIERGLKYNFDYGVMTPKIGVPVVVEQLALTTKKKNSEEAKKFIDWLGSSEMQTLWAQKFGTIPVLPDALEKSPKESKQLISMLNVQQLDWKFIAENIDSWMEKVELQYLK